MSVIRRVCAWMVVVVCVGVGWAWGQSFPYLDVDGTTKNASSVSAITSATTTLSTGWYSVSGDVTISGGTLTVSGNVHLILEDNSHLIVAGVAGNAGIHVPSGNTLTIYAQSIGANAGKLTASGGPFGGAGIGSAVAKRGDKGQFFDARDGKMYVYVTIDGKTWMAENLNFETADSWCYDDVPAKCDEYGRLYTWSAAMSGSSTSSANPSGVQGVCPAGWHLPSNAEWTELVNFVNNLGPAGTRLKSETGWNSGGDGTDDHGFSALPGGGRNSDGYFRDAGNYGRWRSSTEIDGAFA